MKDFLSLTRLPPERIERLLTLAKHVQKEPISDALKGKVIGLLFFNPSLRTLASFQAGASQLGATSFVIQPGTGSWNLETRDGTIMDGDIQEHIREAIPVLSEYADLLGIRAFAGLKSLTDDLKDELIAKMASLHQKPTINMESAADHPCQALADWKTLEDLEIPRTGKFVLSWAWHPKPLPYAVPRAAALMAAQRGMELTVLRPQGFDLPGIILDEARRLGAKNINVTDNVDEAMDGAHVMYCKSWTAPPFYGDPEREGVERAGLRQWCVAESWFRAARPDAKFMHCLPVRRNVKVADEVLDGPRSVVVQQAGNRLHGQKALLLDLLGGSNA